MSNKKSVIKEAQADFEEIKKFAQNEALKQMQKKIQPQLDEIVQKTLEEAIINIESGDATVIVDDDSINVDKDGNKITIETNNNITNTDTTSSTGQENFTENPTSSNDIESSNNEINEEDILFEITNINEEEQAAEANIENPFVLVMNKLNDIERKLEGGTTNSGTAEGEVTIVDDDNVDSTPAPTQNNNQQVPAQQNAVPQQNQQPIQEEYMDYNNEDIMEEVIDSQNDNDDTDLDDLTIDLDSDDSDDDNDEIEFEISDGQTVECNCDNSNEDDDTSVIVDDLQESDFDYDELAVVDQDDIDNLSIRNSSNDSFFGDIDNDNSNDEDVEIIDSDEESSDENEIDEMKGVSFSVSSKGKSSRFPIGQGETSRINIEENIKAQYESKLDELKEENNSLRRDIKEFENSFVELRLSINEMQTFNAKLALANKLFLNGGLSSTEKLAINESLDKASSVKEAQKIYQKIVKDNNILIKESTNNKIKSNTINVANSSKPLYEGNETKLLKEEEEKRRRQILSGIRKAED